MAAAKPINIEQLVILYSPTEDAGNTFSIFNNRALLVKAAEAKGMRTVLINADSIDGKAALLRRLNQIIGTKESVVVISTHGGHRKGTKTDTDLSFKHGTVRYGEFADAVLNAKVNVRGVILNACYSFCDRLRETAKRGEGKLAAAISRQDAEGNTHEDYLVHRALAQIISSASPVPLGPAFEKEALRFRKSCLAQEKPGVHKLGISAIHAFERKQGQLQASHFVDLAFDSDAYRSMQRVCGDPSKLTLETGTGPALFTFGSKEPGIFNETGMKLKACGQPFREWGNVYALPGALVAFRVPTQTNEDQETAMAKNLGSSKHPLATSERFFETHPLWPLGDVAWLECQKDGVWKVVPKNLIRNWGDVLPDWTCSGKEDRKIPIRSCQSFDVVEWLSERNRKWTSSIWNNLDMTDDYEDWKRSPKVACRLMAQAIMTLRDNRIDASEIDFETLCLHKGLRSLWSPVFRKPRLQPQLPVYYDEPHW